MELDLPFKSKSDHPSGSVFIKLSKGSLKYPFCDDDDDDDDCFLA